MSFLEFLTHAAKMLLWWGFGVILILIGLFILWNGMTHKMNFFLMFFGIIIGGIGGLAILYGTRKHDV